MNFAPDSVVYSSADSDGRCILDAKKMSQKRVKFKRKSKHRKEDRSKIVPIKEAQSAEEGIKTVESTRCASKKEKSAKQVHVAFLPEKYQPLVEDDIDQPREDNIKKKQDKYKKLRKVRYLLSKVVVCLIMIVYDGKRLN